MHRLSGCTVWMASWSRWESLYKIWGSLVALGDRPICLVGLWYIDPSVGPLGLGRWPFLRLFSVAYVWFLALDLTCRVLAHFTLYVLMWWSPRFVFLSPLCPLFSYVFMYNSPACQYIHQHLWKFLVLKPYLFVGYSLCFILCKIVDSEKMFLSTVNSEHQVCTRGTSTLAWSHQPSL